MYKSEQNAISITYLQIYSLVWKTKKKLLNVTNVMNLEQNQLYKPKKDKNSSIFSNSSPLLLCSFILTKQRFLKSAIK